MAGGVSKNIWIIANWKSNKTIAEALDWVSLVGSKVEKRPNIKIVVCPSFVDIEEVKKAILVSNFPLMVGSQDLSPYDAGAHTGEETASILKQFVDLSILGHSERRQNFAETDQMIEEKVKQAIEHDIIPLVCVQDDQGLVPAGCKLVAFEPISAIGSGQPYIPQKADSVAVTLKKKYPDIEVLYGGSITKDNAKAFIIQENINGVLVGGASLDAEEFVKIIEACSLI